MVETLRDAPLVLIGLPVQLMGIEPFRQGLGSFAGMDKSFVHFFEVGGFQRANLSGLMDQ